MFYCRIDGKSWFLEHGRYLCPKQFDERDYTGSAKQPDVNNGMDIIGKSPGAMTRALVENLPLGNRSRSRSVLNSLWNCSDKA